MGKKHGDFISCASCKYKWNWRSRAFCFFCGGTLGPQEVPWRDPAQVPQRASSKERESHTQRGLGNDSLVHLQPCLAPWRAPWLRLAVYLSFVPHVDESRAQASSLPQTYDISRREISASPWAGYIYVYIYTHTHTYLLAYLFSYLFILSSLHFICF